MTIFTPALYVERKLSLENPFESCKEERLNRIASDEASPVGMLLQLLPEEKKLFVKVLNSQDLPDEEHLPLQQEVNRAKPIFSRVIHAVNLVCDAVEEAINHRKLNVSVVLNKSFNDERIFSLFSKFLSDRFGITITKEEGDESHLYQVSHGYYKQLINHDKTDEVIQNLLYQNLLKLDPKAEEVEAEPSDEAGMLHKIQKMLFDKIPLEEIASYLQSTKGNGNLNSLCIECFEIDEHGDEGEAHKFYLPYFLLASYSEVFESMFSVEMSEKNTMNVVIDDISPQTFELFVDLLYGEVPKDLNFNDLLHLCCVAKKYMIDSLLEWIDVKAAQLFSISMAGFEEVREVLSIAETYSLPLLKTCCFERLGGIVDYQNFVEVQPIAKQYDLENVVEICQSKDDERLAKFKETLRKAEKGEKKAQFKVAQMYEQGDGTARSLSDAYQWYDAAANKKHPLARIHRAHFQRLGEIVPMDLIAAKSVYEKYKKAGDKRCSSEALFGLGMLLVEENPDKATTLLTKAFNFGHHEAGYEALKVFKKRYVEKQDKKYLDAFATIANFVRSKYQFPLANRTSLFNSYPPPTKEFMKRFGKLCQEMQSLMEPEGNEKPKFSLEAWKEMTRNGVIGSSAKEFGDEKVLENMDEKWNAFLESVFIRDKSKIKKLKKFIDADYVPAYLPLTHHYAGKERSEYLRWAYRGALAGNIDCLSLFTNFSTYDDQITLTYFYDEEQPLKLLDFAAEAWLSLLQNAKPLSHPTKYSIQRALELLPVLERQPAESLPSGLMVKLIEIRTILEKREETP